MHARRLEDRIRGLTEHAIVANEHELSLINAELRSCLREHAKRLREKTLRWLTSGELKERRTSEQTNDHQTKVERPQIAAPHFERNEQF
jgi:hypothetical protein